MEWLEKQAIATAPGECRQKFWKRYVSNVSEMIKNGQVRNRTDHIDTVDPTNIQREDGSVKLLVYRKKSHTDKYLNFSFYRPLNHKLAVIRTLLERCHSIVMEEDD